MTGRDALNTATEQNPSDPAARRARRWSERLARDRFLGRSDERPALERHLDELTAALERHDRKPRAKVAEAIARLRDGLAEAQSALQEPRARLAEQIAKLRAAPDAAPMGAGTAQMLEEFLALFTRRIQPRLTLVLNSIHPRHNLWSGILEDLERCHTEALEHLPQSVLLRYAAGDAPVHPGRSLADAECAAQLDVLCRDPWRAALRVGALRWRLGRRYRHLVIPLRELAHEWLVEHTSVDTRSLDDRHRATHAELERHVQDAARSLRFNLATASSELATRLEQAAGEPAHEAIAELESLVLGAFDQMLERLDETAIVYASVFEGMVEQIAEEHRRDLAAIRSAIADAGSLRGRWRWTRRLLKRSAARASAQLSDRGRQLRELLGRKATSLWRLLTRRGRELQERAGLVEVDEEERLKLADLPSLDEVRTQAEALAPLYRRLFSTEPLVSGEFLVGMDDELKALAEALARWKDGLAANVAIVGPEGSGKTSLLNCLENELAPEVPVRQFPMQERLRTAADVVRALAGVFELPELPDSVPALVQALRALPRCIVRIEHSHMMYLRTIGGREAPEAFFHVMMRTREHLLWLTAFRHYPWRRLDYLFGAGRYYTHVLHTQFRHKAHLREAIERRQRASNQPLFFSDAGLRSRRIAKLRASHRLDSPIVQDALGDDYFGALHRATGGNMIAALYFWLQSIKMEEDGRMVVQPCLRLDERFIAELDRESHFTLAEVLGHGGLSPEEHAEIFRVRIEQSRLKLDTLREARLLEGRERDELGQRRYYVVNPVFHHPMAQTLANLNILH